MKEEVFDEKYIYLKYRTYIILIKEYLTKNDNGIIHYILI